MKRAGRKDLGRQEQYFKMRFLGVANVRVGRLPLRAPAFRVPGVQHWPGFADTEGAILAPPLTHRTSTSRFLTGPDSRGDVQGGNALKYRMEKVAAIIPDAVEADSPRVMAGLGPATHDFPILGPSKTWVAGPSPAMTQGPTLARVLARPGHDTWRVGFDGAWYHMMWTESGHPGSNGGVRLPGHREAEFCRILALNRSDNEVNACK